MTPSDELRALGDEYWETLLRENPTWATTIGDFRWNDALPDLSPEGRDRRRSKTRDFLKRLAALDVTKLSEPDRVSADILRTYLQDTLDEDRHKFYQWEVDQMSGPQADFPQLMNYHPLSDAERLLERFRRFPAYIGQYLDNLREGIREGRVACRAATERVIGQLEAMMGTPPDRSPFAARPDFVPAIRDHLYPAYRKMLDYLKTEYLARTRAEEVGLWALPGGEEAYRYRIRLNTTAPYGAEELHRIGLEEIEGIHREMRRIAGPDLMGFVTRLKADRRNFFESREEILAAARRELERANDKLPLCFERLPRNGCEVKAIEDYREKDSVAAFYQPPDEKQTRKGIFYANTYAPETRPRYNLPALTYHEAVPGHHLQIALALEIEGLPRFRRQTGFTAFVEGWALYTERLADEVGLYETDLARFGMLTYQAWRAARLVTDTGLHALRWSRRRAVDFFLQNVALAEAEVLNEVDRYIIWPGQALAYKVGQREITALREEARAAMGPRFDLRRFHDTVLRNGAIPLSTLRSVVQAWIQS